jgi:hypothetical protein
MEDIPRWLSEMLGVAPKLFHTAEEIAVEKGNISDAMKRMTNPSDAVTPYHGKGI